MNLAKYQELELRILRPLGLARRPVAVAFRESAPPGIEKFSGTQPSGCSFWRIAAEGRTFYTVPSDHYNCPVGSYTHGIALPPDRAPELEQALGLMAGAGYIRMQDVPGVFRLPQTPPVMIYAPLGETPVDPDVVLFSGHPASVMLLEEAALRTGLAAQLPMFGRPTCMAIPAALAQGTVASAGCIGNRIYTGLGEDEMYVAVPGRDLERIAAEIATIASANVQLAEYHRGRRQALSA
jgi:uncharacterized protein (DUF169 family)